MTKRPSRASLPPAPPAGGRGVWSRYPVAGMLLTFMFALTAVFPGLAHAERIRDLGSFQGVRSNQLTGYGIVVGLGGTGDDDLLAAVKTLATALQSGSGGQAVAQTALSQLSDGLNQVSTAQTMVGARLSWIDTTNTIRTQITQQRAQQESDVGSADVTTAVTKLQQTMTALQASQASFVKLSGLSLFSLIQ